MIKSIPGRQRRTPWTSGCGPPLSSHRGSSLPLNGDDQTIQVQPLQRRHRQCLHLQRGLSRRPDRRHPPQWLHNQLFQLSPTGFGLTNAGDPDPNWTVNGNPAQLLAPGAANWYGNWLANGPNSNWIGITASNASNGPAPYTFQTQFDLSSFDLSTVSLSGQWSIDDAGTLTVNGHQIATLGSGNWGSLHPFALAAGSGYLNQGLNTLEITMTEPTTTWKASGWRGLLWTWLPAHNQLFHLHRPFGLHPERLCRQNPGGRKIFRPTTTGTWQSGNAFFTTPISLANRTSFSSAFSFVTSDPGGLADSDGEGADGLVFTIQAQGPTALGAAGAEIGYGRILPSLRGRIDTYQNDFIVLTMWGST